MIIDSKGNNNSLGFLLSSGEGGKRNSWIQGSRDKKISKLLTPFKVLFILPQFTHSLIRENNSTLPDKPLLSFPFDRILQAAFHDFSFPLS